MQLTPMRFTTIEGTEVTVKVSSPEEGRRAVKELRHRKKELGLHRRALVRRQKAAQKERTRREKAKLARTRRTGVIGSMQRMFSLFRTDRPIYDLEGIDQELHMTDEVMHNIDACILQIEGKLLLNP